MNLLYIHQRSIDYVICLCALFVYMDNVQMCIIWYMYVHMNNDRSVDELTTTFYIFRWVNNLFSYVVKS